MDRRGSREGGMTTVRVVCQWEFKRSRGEVIRVSTTWALVIYEILTTKRRKYGILVTNDLVCPPRDFAGC